MFSERKSLWLGLLIAWFAAPANAADVELIGSLEISGKAVDRSGLTDKLGESFPHNQFGGIGAIDYSGSEQRYLLLPDRGPHDGIAEFSCRFHWAEIQIDPSASPSVRMTLLSTTRFVNKKDRQLVGLASQFDQEHPNRGLRFDPEGVRIGTAGQIFVSDEYGPSVCEFSSTGKLVRRFKVPAKFRPTKLSADPIEENAKSNVGRQANGGFEGLALTPDRKKLFAFTQRPLLQDSLANAEDPKKRLGIHNRILELDVESGATREFVYPLEHSTHGVSEVLAVNDHEFLVLERDGKAGLEAVFKKVFHIDLTDATDASSVDPLPPMQLPATIKAVKKNLLFDFLDPRFGLTGEKCPEKFEGITFGPPLKDGRKTLVVTVDNDFNSDNSSWIHVFAIGPANARVTTSPK
jgi:hypothetical protein